MVNIKDKCAIVGIGETEFMFDSGRTEESLALEAIGKAIDDAGLNPKDIDGIVKYTCDTSACDTSIATNLGFPDISYSAEIPHYGGSGPALLTHAALAINGGMAKNVVCFHALTESAARSMFANVDLIRPFYRDARDFIRPFGLTFPLHPFAIMAKRHFHEYGTTSRQLGAITVACRKHASMNPKALFQTPITIEDHQNSKMVMDPIRELDLFSMCDGGCAVVVTSAERAKDLRQRPVYIMAGAQATGPIPHMSWEFHLCNPDILDTTAEHMAKRLFGMAGITPKDIDVAQLYDCISFMVFLELEGYGFCNKGEAGHFVEDGRIELGGELPINTGGGHLAEGYVHGMTPILEGVKQMRGTSTGQVKDAELVLISGAVPIATSAVILRR